MDDSICCEIQSTEYDFNLDNNNNIIGNLPNNLPLCFIPRLSYTLFIYSVGFQRPIIQYLKYAYLNMDYSMESKMSECDYIYRDMVYKIYSFKDQLIINVIMHNLSIMMFSQACIFIECGFIYVNMKRKRFLLFHEFDIIYHKQCFYHAIIYITYYCYILTLFEIYKKLSFFTYIAGLNTNKDCATMEMISIGNSLEIYLISHHVCINNSLYYNFIDKEEVWYKAFNTNLFINLLSVSIYIIAFFMGYVNKLFTFYFLNRYYIHQITCPTNNTRNHQGNLNCEKRDLVNSNVHQNKNVDDGDRDNNKKFSDSTYDISKIVKNEHNYAIMESSICFLSLNICGLKSKLIIPEFRSNLSKYSIICLSESKLDDIDNDFVSNELNKLGFSVYFKNRQSVSNYRSGGLCVIIKNDILPFVSILETGSKLVQWFKIDKSLTGYGKNVIVGNIYIPPRGTRFESDAPFTEIEDEMVNFSDDSNLIILTGDFNAHTKTDKDYIVVDDFIINQLEFDTDIAAMLDDISKLDSLGIDIKRKNKDVKDINAYGTRLLQLCMAHNLIIANGRIGNDSIGNYTTWEGSVIDYVIGNPEIISYIFKFDVKPFDAIYSDKHCRIVWSLKCNNIGNSVSSSNNDVFNDKIKIIKTHKQMWSDDSGYKFNNNISNEKVDRIISDINDRSIPIQNCVTKIEELFKEAANLTLGAEYEFEIDPGKSGKPKFSKETLAKKTLYNKARRLNKPISRTIFTENNLKKASKDYKNAVRIEKLKEIRNRNKRFRSKNVKDRKYFWSMLSSKKTKCKPKPNLNLNTFYNSFKQLASEQNQGEYNSDNDNDEAVIIDEELEYLLDSNFTFEELDILVGKLKNNKACAGDKVLNEFICASYNKLRPVYVLLFNRVLDEGIIPDSWLNGIILPIYKNKGDLNDPDNYRGITLLSCLGKLFTSAVNNRLNKYADRVNLINENQAGFRKKYSTTDHIFLLKNVIDLHLKQKKGKKLFCAFIDYRKAFDYVWRSALWYKLKKAGIKGKLFNIIINMYNNIKSCVTINSECSDYFASTAGVRQGENLSPFLFAIFLNDLEDYLIESNCSLIELPERNIDILLKLIIIMYADDTILLANSAVNLQKGLIELKNYCDKWKLQVNSEKTKVLIFSNRKVKKENYNFKLGDDDLELVDTFKYLGIHFSYNGKFTYAIKELCSMAERAMFSVYKKSRSLKLPVDIQFNLFDRLVAPIMLYSCEVWGFSNVCQIENLHRKFCKMILKLRSTTPNVMIYGETGRFPYEVIIKERMIKFWSRMILGKKEKLSCISYNICRNYFFNSEVETDWISYIDKILTSINYTNWFYIEEFIAKYHIKVIGKDLRKDYIENWYNLVQSAPSCQSLYKHIKLNFESEFYIHTLPEYLRIYISKIRTSNHRLPIQRGRYDRTPREERLCRLCDEQIVGDEFHFILVCKNSQLIELRNQYISPYYSNFPSLEKLARLFENKGRKLFKLAKYIKEAMKLL